MKLICDRYKIQSINELHSHQNNTTLLRVDFNVPIKNNIIVNDSRILSTIATIEFLLKKVDTLILVSHLGDPTSYDTTLSFKAIIKQIEAILNIPIYLSQGTDLHTIALELKDFKANKTSKGLFMLDNIRFFTQEKTNNYDFARDLITYLNLNIYVNDAFSVSHREHTSIVALPSIMQYKYAGFGLMQELYMLETLLYNAFDANNSNITAIIGGKKIETKIKLLHTLIQKTKNVIIVGGMANTFLKARNIEIGDSFYEPNMLNIAKNLHNVILPVDFIDHNGCIAQNINKQSYIGDIGPESIIKIDQIIANSEVVLWNGPAGIYENPMFVNGTNEIAKSISKHNVKSIIGGGDTAVIAKNLNLKFDFISNGGGAFIAWLENNNLCGINAIKVN